MLDMKMSNQATDGKCLIWVKQCHKPPIWERFTPLIYGDLGDGLLLMSKVLMIDHMIKMIDPMFLKYD